MTDEDCRHSMLLNPNRKLHLLSSVLLALEEKPFGLSKKKLKKKTKQQRHGDTPIQLDVCRLSIVYALIMHRRWERSYSRQQNLWGAFTCATLRVSALIAPRCEKKDPGGVVHTVSPKCRPIHVCDSVGIKVFTLRRVETRPVGQPARLTPSPPEYPHPPVRARVLPPFFSICAEKVVMPKLNRSRRQTGRRYPGLPSL